MNVYKNLDKMSVLYCTDFLYFKDMKDKLVGKVKGVYDSHKGFGKQRVNENGEPWDPMKDGNEVDGRKVQISLDGQGKM